MKLVILPVLCTLVATFSLSAVAAEMSSEEKGLWIAQEADKRDLGWSSGVGRIKMLLRNPQGEESVREFRVMALEIEGDGDHNLMVFDSPKDIEGTVFLSYTHIGGVSNEQWLYLPALKRIKRIASDNQSGSWMGSEFAYEDIISQEVGNYTYRYLRDETLNGIDCYVVERYPVDKKTGYSRHVVWYDKAEFRMQQNELYDRAHNELFKTLLLSEYRQIKGFWRADRYEMTNHRTGRQTDFLWQDNDLKAGLDAALFKKSQMLNVR